jgi:hypothetical protein
MKLLLGVAAVGFGLYTLYLRSTAPEKLGKLEAMKEQWGEQNGALVHLAAYTVVPILVGLTLMATSC